MSQDDLAKRIGDMSWQQIQRYELGQSRLPASLIPDLAKVLHVENAYFVMGLYIGPDTIRKQAERNGDVRAFLASDDGVMVMMTMLRARPILRTLLIRVTEMVDEINQFIPPP